MAWPPSAENIRWGKPEASIEEVIEAAQIAQAHEFITEKPDGYNEVVEQKGSSLSGGQKQRLSIARAVVKRPEILIFDDSTSALDLLTESKLYKALNEKLRNTTKIVVAQRIATAKNADKIIVLSKNSDGYKIQISRKQAYSNIKDPDRELNIDDVVTARIGQKTDGGYFCEVTPGITGILDTEYPYKEGDNVTVYIKKIGENGLKLGALY